MSDSHAETFNIITKVQLYGVLNKKSIAPHTNKWSKRFFIVKEGFLLYYSENERKSFEKKGYFNIHPKGVIPVGGCIIQAGCDSSQEYVIHITSDSFVNGSISLGAETKFDQERWIRGLQEAARITWENSRMGESIIRDLETQGLQLNKEKQSYVDKLNVETIALRDEIDKNEELERLNTELDEEKQRLERLIQELQQEQERMKEEYEETLAAMKVVEEEKQVLQSTTQTLMDNLSKVEVEKRMILDSVQGQLNAGSSSLPQILQVHLLGLEEETRCLLEEKNEIEERFQENELKAKVLEEEQQIISEQSSQILSSLNDLLTQKDLPDSELRLEVSARLEAERRLRSAQDSVQVLEGALQTDISPSTLRSKILPDVKRLRMFFEHLAEEAKIDANMPVIMKNSVYARKSLAKKARSQLLEQSRVEKAKCLENSRTFSSIISSSNPPTKLREECSTDKCVGAVSGVLNWTATANLHKRRGLGHVLGGTTTTWLDVLEQPDVNLPLKRSLSFMITKKSVGNNLCRSHSTRSFNGSLLGSRRSSLHQSSSSNLQPVAENNFL